MRYYDLQIKNKDGDNVLQTSLAQAQSGSGAITSYATSFVNGQSIPAAQNIELDIPLYNYATPKQGALLRLWGVSINDMAAARKMAYGSFIFYAGMKKGLPLAKPSQSKSVLLQGTVFQAFGNWQGTEMTLDMILLPSIGNPTAPFNISYVWKANTPLAGAIQGALSTSLKQYTIKIAISDQLKLSSDQPFVYRSLTEFAAAIIKLTAPPPNGTQTQFAGIKTQSGTPYTGVHMTIKGTTLLVYDGTEEYAANSFSKPLQIAFEDLIGQPTWLDAVSISIKTVLRSDIAVGDHIMLPTTLATPYVITTQQAALPNVPSREKSVFQGVFLVTNVHHFGNFRQPDGSAWVTVLDCVVVKLSSPSPSANS